MPTAGDRIRAERMRLGMQQTDLASSIGVAKSTMSRIESGARDVKSTELADIADILGVSMRDLLGRRQPSRPLVIAHRLDGASTASESAKGARQHFRQMLELESLLEEVGLPIPPRPSPPVDASELTTLDPVDQGTEMAGRVREALGVGEAPLPALWTTIEHAIGPPVSGIPAGDASSVVSGASVTTVGYSAILVNTSKRSTHQRFTLAHELGHVILDGLEVEFRAETAEDLFRKDRIEVRANAFAAALLMPEMGLRKRIESRGNMDGAAFTDLLFAYGVSKEALAYRLHNLRLINASARDQALTWSPSVLARRYNRQDEFKDLENDLGIIRPPTELYSKLMEAYTAGLVGIGPIAGLLHEDPDSLRKSLERDGLGPQFDESEDVLATL